MSFRAPGLTIPGPVFATEGSDYDHSSRTRPRTSAAAEEGGQQVADVFVIFGITGDLAKVMTFHSLYRLEQRGLLSCPIVGVAVSDWSDDDLRSHAREAIIDCGDQIDEAVFDRLAGADVVCERRLRRRSDV